MPAQESKEQEDSQTLCPGLEDVGCWWLYREEWGWQPVIVAYNSFIQAGDAFRHPIRSGMTWGGKIIPPIRGV